MDDEIALVDEPLQAGDREVPGQPTNAGSSREGSLGGNDGGGLIPPGALPTSAAAGRSGGVGTGPEPHSTASEPPRVPPSICGADPRPAPTSARADSRSVARWKRTLAALGRIVGGAR